MSNSCDPVDCSLPRSSVHGILQARILEWVAIPSSGGLPDPGIKPWSSALQADLYLLSYERSPRVCDYVYLLQNDHHSKSSCRSPHIQIFFHCDKIICLTAFKYRAQYNSPCCTLYSWGFPGGASHAVQEM